MLGGARQINNLSQIIAFWAAMEGFSYSLTGPVKRGDRRFGRRDLLVRKHPVDFRPDGRARSIAANPGIL
jgi:hypothetical protein